MQETLEPLDKTAIISRILTFSCVDGPGNRLVLFLQGCNFNCLSCHNPHTINYCQHCHDCVPGCPTAALHINSDNKVVWDKTLCIHCDQCTDVCSHNANPKTSRYSVVELIQIIRQHRHFIGGITVSGGEATIQLPFIIVLFQAIKENSDLCHLTCFIDSNGYLPEKAWQRVLPWLDGAMIDLKAWQTVTHRWLTGRNNHRVIHSIRYLASVGKLHELRLLHIPEKSDLEREVENIANLIQELPGSVQIRLNAFHHHGVTGEALAWEICDKETILAFHQQLRSRVEHTLLLPRAY